MRLWRRRPINPDWAEVIAMAARIRELEAERDALRQRVAVAEAQVRGMRPEAPLQTAADEDESWVIKSSQHSVRRSFQVTDEEAYLPWAATHRLATLVAGNDGLVRTEDGEIVPGVSVR